MSTTPPPASPAKVSQSQQDIVDDEPLNVSSINEEQEDAMSDGMSAQSQIKQSQKQQDEVIRSDPLVVTEPRRHQTRTPEPRQRRSRREEVQRSLGTPGNLPPFDWEEFESRYMRALADADEHEREILEEFDQLVKYFNVWASTSSSHDNDRAVKRLQTRTRYVHISEEKLKQKKVHLTEVVKAFQSALALLSTE